MYESFTVVHPGMSETEVADFASLLERRMNESNIRPTKKTIRMRQTLAYPIEKQREGHIIELEYLLEASSTNFAELHQEIRHNEKVLRHLFFGKDDKAPEVHRPRSVLGEMRLEERQRASKREGRPLEHEGPRKTHVGEAIDQKEIDRKIEELLK